jgi:hypothetical protein
LPDFAIIANDHGGVYFETAHAKMLVRTALFS